jgi:endonuclease/exonuclease/phosphatase family metal-dependent hydrolase
MRIRVSAQRGRLCVRGMFGLVAVAASAVAASAQTVVTLNQPPQVLFATLRAGTYADKNVSATLATRASDNPDYRRRALLKFDTQNTIPAGSNVTSALLTVTVKLGSGDATRNIAAYQVTSSWTENEVTWKSRRSGESWVTAGGDLGTKLDENVVGNVAGTRVTYDVTALVKRAVAGSLGSSRYTRVVLIDLDGSTSDSYREFFLPNDSNVANRPVLKVTYSGTATTPIPTPPPVSATGTTLRVLHWNTHHGGYGTDGRWDPNRLISKAASFHPDVVSMNEVERFTSWGNADDPALFASLMKKYTGQTWYYKFQTAAGGTTGNGNLVMSRFPFIATHTHLLSYKRSAVDATIDFNGRAINLTSTHLDDNSTSERLTEIGQLSSWETTLAEQRIICGDFNAWPGTTEVSTMKRTYYDSWGEAQADGTSIAYPGNTAGNTRNSRIDYIWYSHGASNLVLKQSQVFDVRDANGIMPSDHRPIMTTFIVK